MPPARRAWRCLTLLAYALIFLCPLVFARAGGGGHYSGGGGSGGGYSGGGGGGGAIPVYLIYLYLQFVFAHPVAGVPMTAALAYVAFVAYANHDTMLVSADRMHSTISQGSELQAQNRMQENFAKLKARDPGFEPDAFLRRVEQAFLKVQQAWSGQDMAPARAFISDGVMERFTIQLEMQKADGKRNIMDAVKVEGSRMLEVESDRFFDTLHVRISASAIDKEVSLKDGALIFGSNEPSGFAEIWSFVRRPGAKTLKNPGLLEGFCPSCGAPLPIADAAQCLTCKTWVNSGEFDWVLCEITQEEEWGVRGAGDDVPGFKELSAADPGLSTQFLEDRASVAFWRWQWAMEQKSAAPMRSVATESFCKAMTADGSRFRDAAVGTVEVQAFEAGTQLDSAHVMVKWSGEWFDAAGASQGQVLRQHVIVFGRKAGVKTDARAGLRSARCAACGAPPARRDQAACEYCGASFNDGSRQWTVFEIVPIGLWKRPAAAAQGAAIDADWAKDLSPVDALALLMAAMASDGRIDDKELALLKSFAQSRAIRPETVAAMLESAKQGHLDLPKPADAAQARACLRGLAQMALADGRVSDEEVKFMTAFAAPFGLGESDVWAVVKEQRTALYRQTKGLVKNLPAST